MHSPWSGPVDGVNWRAAPPAVFFYSNVTGREGECLFVLHPIEHRYSSSPSLSSLDLFLLSSRFCVWIVLCSHMSCVTTHALFYFFCLASVASPLDSLIAPAKETYPVVLCYITIRTLRQITVNLFIQISCCVIQSVSAQLTRPM